MQTSMKTSSATCWMLAAGMLIPMLSGCAAFRPIHGVPARYVADEFRGPSRSDKQTIDLSLLRQDAVSVHRVDANDLLSIYIEGILGRREEQPPVYFPQNSDTPPTVGYPIPVRDDGTISLPLVGSVSVRGLSIREIEDKLRRAYTVDQKLLVDGRDRIFVALQIPRTYRILVIRQEASSDLTVSTQGQLNIGTSKRGTGKVVNLPVYKNDVLNALAETGGLPGLDAENAIYIIRGQNGPRPSAPTPIPAATPHFSAPRSTLLPSDTVIRGQSPSGIQPMGDYRANAGGWSQPTTSYLQPVSNQETAPAPLPPMLPPLPAANPYPIPQQAVPPAIPHAPPPMAPMWTPPPTEPYSPAPPNLQPEPNWPALPTLGPEVVGEWSGQYGDQLQGRHIIRIPIRLGPGEYTDIRPEDVLLYDGDIVFIESRETEVFYTGGLLGGGQYTLPRDYDLDALGAIAVAQGQRGGGGSSRATQSQGGQSALNADVSISASQLIILRPLPDGSQLTMQVDLYEAVRNPNERVIIQPGDYLILQYTRCEAVMAFIERHLLEGALFGVAAAQLNSGGN